MYKNEFAYKNRKEFEIAREKYLSTPIVLSKESRYQLQSLDCNCNDCFFMERNFDRFKASLAFHKSMQQSLFDGVQSRMFANAEDWKTKAKKPNDDQCWKDMTKLEIQEERASMMKKFEYLMKEAKKMRFVFDKSHASINFGDCTKLNKEVTFLSNVMQLDTQECFEHRIDHLDEETKKKRLGL